MKIGHIAFWTADLEKMKDFYIKYFGAVSNDKYTNPKTGLETYFLSFKSGAQIEIMNRPDVILETQNYLERRQGFAHFAFEMENSEEVDKMTDLLRQNGYRVHGEPRMTGDGYYESVILDPEYNTIELVYNPSESKNCTFG